MRESKAGVPTSTEARETPHVYLMDGALLGLFMISACLSVALLEHSSSPLRQQITSAFARRALVGIAMGLTAVGLIYSPWGKRSGAFMNPALVLCFVRLGKLRPLEGLGYAAAQFAGGTLGVAVCAWWVNSWVSDPGVNYVATAPGSYGVFAAFLGEFMMGFSMLTTVMTVNRVPRWAPFAGFFAAALVALFIMFEAPLSGMSMNPARSFASALFAHNFRDFWIYLTAPGAGMLLAVELQRLLDARRSRLCGKLSHSEKIACFVRCNCLDSSRSK